MNALIGMIADFLDRLSDPAFGRQTNEAYNLRLGILLDNDEGLSAQLANAELSPDDVPALSLSSWLWYLRWRTLRGGRVPGDAFLSTLYDVTDEPIVRLRIVETVVTNSRDVHGAADEVPERRGLSGLPDNWLSHRMYTIVSERETESEEGASPEEQAWELSAYLLQLGDDFSLTALRALLAQRWSGRQYLIRQIQEILVRPGLEPEAVERLRRQLGLAGADE
jgi:hypothetical protein